MYQVELLDVTSLVDGGVQAEEARSAYRVRGANNEETALEAAQQRHLELFGLAERKDRTIEKLVIRTVPVGKGEGELIDLRDAPHLRSWVDKDNVVRASRPVPGGELQLVLNDDGLSVDKLDDAGEVVDSRWIAFDDLDPAPEKQ